MPKSSTDEPLDSLVNLACRDGVDIRPILLRALTDLYTQKPAHTTEEQNQYIELALGLLTAADGPTRAAIAARLRDYPAAPQAVLRKLAEIDTVGGVMPLARNATSIRRRSADGDLIELFFTASPEERRLILINLDVAIRAPHRLLAATGDASARLEKAGMQCDTNEFTRILENSLGVSRSLAQRILNDAFGEPLVVVARALGMKAPMLRRVLLAPNPSNGRSATRVSALMQLFEEVPAHVADYMICVWQQPSIRSSVPYESVHWNDEHRDARSMSSSTQYNFVRDHNVPGRIKTGSR